MLIKVARTAFIFCILSAYGLLPGVMLAQTTDPLIGTWSFTATVTGGCTTNCKYIGMIGFNQGGTATEQRGTATEYYGLGYVERTALGKWQRSTATYPYTLKMKNFVFDSTGNLSGFVVANSNIKLSSTSLNSFSGYGKATIFSASGTPIETVTVTIAGMRF